MKTAADILPLLQRWADTITALDAAMDALKNSVGRDPHSPLHVAAYNSVELATELVAQRIGDTDDWLQWYWLENDMGAKGYEVVLKDRRRKISSLAELAAAIAEDLAA